MLTHITAAKCLGIQAVEVLVEVGIERGIGIHLVGLADAAVKESLLRTATALESLGYHIPGKKIIINLAPADLRKNGSGYDLPIAIGIISASGQRNLPLASKFIIMGELGLDGSLRAIPGALPYAQLAIEKGYEGIILPLDSALEAADCRDTAVFGVRNLAEVVKILEGKEDSSEYLVWNTEDYNSLKEKRDGLLVEETVDLRDIVGQQGAKRGLEIAAAGGHNLIMIGAPGSGKSSLAKALSGILPPMTPEESLTTSKVYSVLGRNTRECGLMKRRPFRSPHYSISIAAMIGGGSGDNIVPGEVSLATGGVLFLDEMGQMPRSVIEALRGPIEDRKVCVYRLKSKVEYPSSFMLVAASNPCPCGYWGVDDRCSCTPSQRMSYLGKLSGPMMDRIDIQLTVRPVPPEAVASGAKAESSREVAERVTRAREIQQKRFAQENISTNAEMNNKLIEKYCPLSKECRDTMGKIMEKMQLSLRAYFRIIKLARTIADLEGSSDIKERHLVEAAGFRILDREKIL